MKTPGNSNLFIILIIAIISAILLSMSINNTSQQAPGSEDGILNTETMA